jgi:hypothetical protein
LQIKTDKFPMRAEADLNKGKKTKEKAERKKERKKGRKKGKKATKRCPR